MGHDTPHTEFAQWCASRPQFASATLVLGAQSLDRCLENNSQVSTMALFDVLASRSPFELLLEIDTRLAEACEIVIGASAPAADWKPDTLAMAQRFGFSEIDDMLPAPPHFEYLYLRRSKRPQFRLGKITAANASEMRELFSRIFGHQMGEAFWRWKYRDGSNHGMGLWQDGQMVAHYGGLAEDIVLDGKPAKAMQMVDVMVDPKVRHAARRQSPFFILTSAFTECFIGWKKPYLLAFGFPSRRHLQLAEHLKLYAPVAEMNEVVFAARPPSLLSRFLLRREVITLENFTSFKPALDALWDKMHTALPETTFVEKNAARIHRRYLSHPEIRYQVQLIRNRWSNEPLAVVVLKEQPDNMLLMDVVGDPASFAQVLSIVQSQLQKQTGKPLTAWISSTFTSALASAQDQVNALPISVPTITWTEGPKPEHLKDRWWLTAGDTDFL